MSLVPFTDSDLRDDGEECQRK